MIPSEGWTRRIAFRSVRSVVIDPLSLVALGALFLAGLMADLMARQTGFPRVTLLLLLGLLVGSSGFDLIPDSLWDWYEFLSVTALTMVAFLLGSALKLENLRRNGAAIILISLSIVFVTLVVVGGGLVAAGVPLGLALLLAAIATATAPAATNDVITQSGRDNRFTQTLRGIVAIDDVWGLVVFSFTLVVVSHLNGQLGGTGLSDAGWEVFGAVLLGALVGAPAAFLTGRLNDGEPLEVEALSLVFLTAGLALWLEVSFLIAGMTVGAVIVNAASHHQMAFHEIEHIQWPFMVLFFILAGAALEIEIALSLGLVGFGFIALRLVARIFGGWLGAHLARAPARERVWYGIALMPQAGIAIGMALVASQRFPEWRSEIIAVTIGATVVFEILGPIATLIAIRKTEQAQGGPGNDG